MEPTINDIRLVELRKRESQAMGSGVLGGIALVVAGSALIAVGYYITQKFFNKVDTSGFSAEQNTTFEALKTSSNDAFDMTGLLLWAAVAVTILGLIIGGIYVLTR